MTDKTLQERLRLLAYAYDLPDCTEAAEALDAKDARIKELEGIILWALGENGEFPDIPENWDALKYKPMYYWRKEMRVRFARAREALNALEP